MNIQTGTAHVNETQLYYEIVGEGEPLVFIHGFALDSRMWDDQVEYFALHYQLIRYDLRGFGKSNPSTNEAYSHVEDLSALLTHLGLTQAHIMGLSLGGSIAIDFCLTHPDRVASLILVDAGLNGFTFSQDWVTRWRAARSEAVKNGVMAAKQLWLTHPLLAPALENTAVNRRLQEMLFAYSGWHWLNKDPHRLLQPPAIKRLSQIQAPTLVIVGERDIDDFQAISSILQEQIPQSHQVTLPDVGHLANMEEPNQFNRILNEFLTAF